MTKNPKFLQSGGELRDAVKVFLKNGVKYSPVLNPGGEVLGLMSEFALIKASVKRHLDPKRHEKIAHHLDLLDEAHFVEPDDSLDEVVKALFRSPSHRLIVRNKQKKMIGIISPKDILRFLTGEQDKEIDLRTELEETQKEAQKLSKQLTSMHENLTRYKSLYNETPYMMHSVNSSGTIILANKKIHRRLGYGNDELIGKPMTHLYPSNVHQEAAKGLEHIIESGSHNMTYTSIMTKEGKKVRVDMSSSSLHGKRGEFIGTITISREIDSEHLLRALHKVVSKYSDLPESLKEELKEELSGEIINGA